jgi:hypothetical protein
MPATAAIKMDSQTGTARAYDQLQTRQAPDLVSAQTIACGADRQAVRRAYIG